MGGSTVFPCRETCMVLVYAIHLNHGVTVNEDLVTVEFSSFSSSGPVQQHFLVHV